MTLRSADVAVVGGGIVGLATADALAQAGAQVRCFEPAEPGSGQSAGLTRVFRHVHLQPELVTLANAARTEWDAWSERASEPLVGDEGVLYAGPDGREAGRLLADAGVEHRFVSEDEQRELLPLLAPPTDDALYDVRGGALRVRPSVRALVSRLGDRLVREEVLAVHKTDEGARLLTPEGIWRCERVVVCAGVRTRELARSLDVEIPVATSVHVRLAFAVRDEHRGARLACWLDRTGAYGATVYSGPLPGMDGFAVGLATEDQFGRDPSFAQLRGYVERALPGLDPTPVAYRPCRLTVLPWHGDAFAAWQTGPVVFFAGSNLFKFAPTVGRLLAEAATTGSVPEPLRPPT
jgi:sarcosine oxidase